MGAYKLLINGEMVDGDLSMDVLNPATEEVLADCPRASEDQLNAAVAAAKQPFLLGRRPMSTSVKPLS